MSVNRNKRLEQIVEKAGVIINDLIAPDGYYTENNAYFIICKRIASSVQTLDNLYDITDELGLEGSSVEMDIEKHIEEEEKENKLEEKIELEVNEKVFDEIKTLAIEDSYKNWNRKVYGTKEYGFYIYLQGVKTNISNEVAEILSDADVFFKSTIKQKKD